MRTSGCLLDTLILFMISNSFYQTLSENLQSAKLFFSIGEKNKARVIARQVAGKAIRSLLQEINIISSSSLNPYQCLLIAKENYEIFSNVMEDLNTLTQKVNPDYTFPEELDLIKSAKNILDFVKEFN